MPANLPSIFFGRRFSVPLADWLRGPLRELAESALFDRETYPAGLFERSALEGYWQEHLSGEHDHKWGLWSLLCLQWWSRRHLHARQPEIGSSAPLDAVDSPPLRVTSECSA